MILSPITGKTTVSLEEKKTTKEIIQGYKQTFNIDVSSYFVNVPEIEIYRCLDTDYRFYYPFHITGDGLFYDQLQKQPWYYTDWKWEYQVAFDLFHGKGILLEIGCGKGSFLKRIQATGKVCIGLELSEDAIKSGIEEKLDIRNQVIEQHALHNEETYDIVCSFQLLEHISSVDSLLKSSLKVLKKGGKMLVAVPNNDALFLKYRGQTIDNLNHLYQPTKLLNLPPHHMGLWNKKSLTKLSSIYNMQLDTIFTEPMNEHRRLLNKSILTKRLGTLGKLISKTKTTFVLENIFSREFMFADTIMAVYTKL
jgi:2-polyprenyl-3-methyl-5-hydroxy-6-metoxy-1,4-benzoquinol methylase